MHSQFIDFNRARHVFLNNIALKIMCKAHIFVQGKNKALSKATINRYKRLSENHDKKIK